MTDTPADTPATPTDAEINAALDEAERDNQQLRRDVRITPEMANTPCGPATPDPQPTLARATDLLRAFAMHPEHPDYQPKMLEIKGLLETTEERLAAPQDGDRTFIVGNYTIDRLRRGETVEANGITLLPADDLTAAPVSGDLDAKLRAAATARDVLAPYWNGTSRLLTTTEWEDLRTTIAKAIYGAAAPVSGDAATGQQLENAADLYNRIRSNGSPIRVLAAALTAAEDKAQRELLSALSEIADMEGQEGMTDAIFVRRALHIANAHLTPPTPEKGG